jgi:hypothetical protein
LREKEREREGETHLDGGDVDIEDLGGVGPVVQQPPPHAA